MNYQRLNMTSKYLSRFIIRAKTVSKGLFSFKYVEFIIETQPLNWTVGRRFSDFESLSEALKKQFPGYSVPKLLHTKKGSRFDAKNIEWRRRNLQRFLEEIVLSPVLSKAMIFLSFLKIDKPAELNRKFEEIKKEPIPIKLSQFRNAEGCAKVKYDAKSEKKCENVGKFILSSSTYMIKYANHIAQ